MRSFLIALGWAVTATWALGAPVIDPLPEGSAAEEVLSKGTRLAGIGGGVSLGTREYGGTVTHDLVIFQVGYGIVVSDLLAEERFWRGRVLLAGEFLFGRQFKPDTAVLFGATPLVRYVVDTGGRWKPFVEGGVGFALTDIGGPSLGGKLQFSPQGGAGVYWFMKRDLALAAQHRFIHYSNASLRSPNVGINQHVFLVGLTRFY
jgi:lipid A 3-O-deacylase